MAHPILQSIIKLLQHPDINRIYVMSSIWKGYGLRPFFINLRNVIEFQQIVIKANDLCTEHGYSFN